MLYYGGQQVPQNSHLARSLAAQSQASQPLVRNPHGHGHFRKHSPFNPAPNNYSAGLKPAGQWGAAGIPQATPNFAPTYAPTFAGANYGGFAGGYTAPTYGGFVGGYNTTQYPQYGATAYNSQIYSTNAYSTPYAAAAPTVYGGSTVTNGYGYGGVFGGYPTSAANYGYGSPRYASNVGAAATPSFGYVNASNYAGRAATFAGYGNSNLYSGALNYTPYLNFSGFFLEGASGPTLALPPPPGAASEAIVAKEVAPVVVPQTSGLFGAFQYPTDQNDVYFDLNKSRFIAAQPVIGEEFVEDGLVQIGNEIEVEGEGEEELLEEEQEE